MKKLAILISTYEGGIYRVPQIVSQKHKYLSFVVVHQVDSRQHYEEYCSFIDNELSYQSDIKVYSMIGKGVTKSRNMAIEKVPNDCDYVLFCDDDVILEDDIYELVVSSFDNEKWDAITFTIKDMDGEKLIKNYPSKPIAHNDFSILKVGTIEVAVRLSLLKSNASLRFPEYLGAGAFYPLCDEPVFLKRLLRARAVVGFLPHTIMRHPIESSGKYITNTPAMISRGIAFREIFGIGSFLLSFIFFVKSFNKIKYNKLRALYDLYVGVFMSTEKWK